MVGLVVRVRTLDGDTIVTPMANVIANEKALHFKREVNGYYFVNRTNILILAISPSNK